MSGGEARGRLFVISGPSGSGKTTIIKSLKWLPGIFYSVSATSRAPRPGEADGRDYWFVTREQFEKMAREGLFAEHAEVAGNFYGTPAGQLDKALAEGRAAVVDIDVQGAMQIKRKFPQATLVFIEPPDIKALEARLRKRGTESEAVVERRLALARREMECAKDYDYRVVNDSLEEATRRIKDIILGKKG